MHLYSACIECIARCIEIVSRYEQCSNYMEAIVCRAPSLVLTVPSLCKNCGYRGGLTSSHCKNAKLTPKIHQVSPFLSSKIKKLWGEGNNPLPRAPIGEEGTRFPNPGCGAVQAWSDSPSCFRHRAPTYLADYCVPVSEVAGRQHLRYATCHQLSVLRVHHSTFGTSAFSVAGPRVWNSLADHLRDPAADPEQFRRDLKTYLFAGHSKR